MIPRAIRTPRLRLRALTLRDLALFQKLYCDAETMRHIGRPMRHAEAEASLRATVEATRRPNGPRFFVIVESRNRRSIGLCSLRGFSTRTRRAELGIMLLPSACSHGYGNEAVSAMLDLAFQTLPIEAVWVQYRPANVIAARVCDALGFVKTHAQQSHGTKSVQCTRTLRRPGWRKPLHQPITGNEMSNIIGFLENAGRDAALRHASREQLLRRMRQEDIEPMLQNAVLQTQRMAIDGLLGVRDTMYCQNVSIKSPKKKAPAKKAPAKAPPKKAPAKKPAKKAPAKKPAKKAPSKR